MKYPFVLKTSMEIAAPIEKACAALTEPESVKILFWGSELVTTWEVGTPIAYRGEWEGVEFEDHGTVLAFDPPHLVKYNYWSSFAKDELADLPENYQTITYTFEPSEGGTTVSIEQDNIRSTEVMEHSEQNWQHLLGAIKSMLEVAV
ncbi:MAG TPA: SRPBCC family protein [Haliscomenobacter sp.]|nr:SRPBCC family protein [Haliscomenobacter sp.]